MHYKSDRQNIDEACEFVNREPLTALEKLDTFELEALSGKPALPFLFVLKNDGRRIRDDFGQTDAQTGESQTMSPSQKAQLIEAFERLPDAYKREVLDYMGFLASRAQVAKDEAGNSKLPEGGNPFHAFLGAVYHGRLTGGIDEELYG